ncbi:MAG: oligosaccharide flippase family protein [Burkholderiaceae bacterium]|nr:oligosaccharide flippase family protein [Burkholderiaceae bacterium]MDH3459494.1 oligosaccharide flippase family protein [Burkholderiaceae bacterium]
MKWRGFLGATACYVIANGVFSGLPLLLLPWLTRGLGPAGYGTWVAFSVIVAAIVSLGGLSTHSYLILEWPKTAVRAQRAGLAAGAALAGVVGVSLALPLAATYLWLAPAAVGLAPDWALMATLMAAATVALLVFQSIWQSEFRAKHFMAFRLMHALALALATLVVLYLFPGRWQAVAIAATLITGAAMVACLVVHSALFVDGVREVRAHFAPALRFGVTLLPHSLGGVAMSATDKLLVGSMLSAAELGPYGVAAQVGLILALLNDSANRSYAPWLAHALTKGLADDAERARSVVRGTYVAFAGIMLLSLSCGLLLPRLLPHLTGAGFAKAGDYLLPICIGHGFTGMYFLVVNYVMYSRRFAILALVSLSAGAANVVLGLLLVPRIGAIGAAWAFATSQALLFFGAWYLAGRVVPMPWQLSLAHGTRS